MKGFTRGMLATQGELWKATEKTTTNNGRLNPKTLKAAPTTADCAAVAEQQGILENIDRQGGSDDRWN